MTVRCSGCSPWYRVARVGFFSKLYPVEGTYQISKFGGYRQILIFGSTSTTVSIQLKFEELQLMNITQGILALTAAKSGNSAVMDTCVRFGLSSLK